MVFPVVMFMTGCESWTIKKAEHRRIHASEVWFWRRLLRWMWELDHKESWAQKNSCFWSVVLEKTLESPLDCKEIQPVYPKGDQSWVFIGRTDAEAETAILWPPDARADSLEKTLMLGKIEGRRRRGRKRIRWLDGITDSMNMGLGRVCHWWWTGRPEVLQFMGSQRVRHGWETGLNWTELKHLVVGLPGRVISLSLTLLRYY